MVHLYSKGELYTVLYMMNSLFRNDEFCVQKASFILDAGASFGETLNPDSSLLRSSKAF